MTNILHVKASSKCQAACPMCMRNTFGEGQLFPNKDLTLDELQRVDIDFTTLGKTFFCGNTGDPACSPYIFTLSKFLRNQNPNITLGMNTNGGIRKPEWWTDLASYFNQTYDYTVFSIDGLEDTNHIYRRNVDFDRVMKNAQAFIDAGGSASWDMLVFEHNKHQVDECIKLADKMGFNWFRVKETSRWDNYSPEKVGVYPVYDPVPYDLNTKVNCEKDRENSLYVDCYGKVWPCCHMASAYENKMDIHNDLKAENRDDLMELYKGFNFKICKEACGSRPKKSQWKKEIQLR